MASASPVAGRLPVVFAAPHRLPFLVGAANLLLLAAWWLVRLAEPFFGVALLPAGTFPAALLHGPAMVQLVFPPFVFGFLLTVFPRWMGYPDLTVQTFGPIGALLAAASAIAQIGLWTANAGLFATGLGLEAVAWIIAIAALARVTLRHAADGRPRNVHAWSALAALLFGLAGLVLSASAVMAVDGMQLLAAIRIATYGFLLPVFLTVAHRMVPFFAGNVVKNYSRWRPDWLLAVIWLALLTALAGAIMQADMLVIAGNAAMVAISLVILWKWWPRGAAPGLLRVLFWGLAWTPVGFALSALVPLDPQLGRAPVHILLLGFCGSMLIAMVTRVTQGHSGRPLEMSRAAWIAFAGIQLATLLRVTAALRFEDRGLLVAGGVLFLIGTAPWCVTNLAIYLRPRVDGKPG